VVRQVREESAGARRRSHERRPAELTAASSPGTPEAAGKDSRAPAAAPGFSLSSALLAACATSERINRYLLENLTEEAWRAEPPGGKGRTIAAIASHIHNVRRMWLKVAAKGSPLPDELDRLTVTREEAIAALAESHAAIDRLVSSALAGDGRIKGFRPDVASFVGYLIAHEAHHRGQITMLARQVGCPVSQKTMFGMWEWGTR
jgi:uncharacterized damage-inducible protein DinB